MRRKESNQTNKTSGLSILIATNQRVIGRHQRELVAVAIRGSVLFICSLKASFVGPQNAPLHNMLLLVAYCVPCIHNMLHWSILCTLHTQYATSGAYCVGSIHMLFQWSSEGTQYALLENMSRGICLFF